MLSSILLQSVSVGWDKWLGFAVMAAIITGCFSLCAQLLIAHLSRRNTKEADRKKKLNTDKEIVGKLFGQLVANTYLLKNTYMEFLPYHFNISVFNLRLSGENTKEDTARLKDALKHNEELSDRHFSEVLKTQQLCLASLGEITFIMKNQELDSLLVQLRDFSFMSELYITTLDISKLTDVSYVRVKSFNYYKGINEEVDTLLNRITSVINSFREEEI